MACGCADCESMMQPYLDGVLSDEQVEEAKEHLDDCPGCDKRYRFEEDLRRFVQGRGRRADVSRAAGEARGAPAAVR